MKFHYTFVLGLFLVCAHSAAVQGEMRTYNVNLGGSYGGGPELRVDGTIQFDTVLAEITASNLVLHRLAENISLTEGPFIGNSNPSSWHWTATQTELRFVSDLPDFGGYVIWRSPLGVYPFGWFELTTRTLIAPEPLMAIQYELPTSGEAYPVYFDHGPPGILIGTAAIPEPSVTLLASAFAGMAGGMVLWRRRQHASRIRSPN